MAAGFSVKDALNKNSKAGIDESPRARFRTKDISIFKMYRNDMNFYSVADIEELAGDILLSGLKQNLELVYAPCEKGEYRIVAGERRWEALKYLVSKGYKDFELATSKLTTPQDDDEEQVEIIIANSYRSKTISDMIEEETRLKASLERMKAAGKKIKGYDLQSGRLRDVISSMLHVSKTKIAQIEAINNNLIPEWKEELKKERLTFSAAYELSGMTEDEQRETLGKFSETGELTHKEVKDMKEAKAAGQQVSESDTEENGMNPPEQERATIMRHLIRRESHLSVIPAPNTRLAMLRPEHVPHATSTRTVRRHTRPMNRDIQRSRMQSTVRQRKNSVRWSRRRKCRTSRQIHRRPDRKCIRYALQSRISMM